MENVTKFNVFLRVNVPFLTRFTASELFDWCDVYEMLALNESDPDRRECLLDQRAMFLELAAFRNHKSKAMSLAVRKSFNDIGVAIFCVHVIGDNLRSIYNSEPFPDEVNARYYRDSIALFLGL